MYNIVTINITIFHCDPGTKDMCRLIILYAVKTFTVKIKSNNKKSKSHSNWVINSFTFK